MIPVLTILPLPAVLLFLSCLGVLCRLSHSSFSKLRNFVRDLGCGYTQGAFLPRKNSPFSSPVKQEFLSPLSPSPSHSSTPVVFLFTKGLTSKWKDQLQLNKKQSAKAFKQQNFFPADDQYYSSLVGTWKGLEFELVLMRKRWVPVQHKPHTYPCVTARPLRTNDDQSCKFHLTRGVGWFLTQSAHLFFAHLFAIQQYN